MRKNIRRGLVVAAAATGLWALGTASASASAAELPDAGSVTDATGTTDSAVGTVHQAAGSTTGDLPATDVPAADLPATDLPATDVPATDVPATDLPATDVPAADLPATDVPATGAPMTGLAHGGVFHHVTKAVSRAAGDLQDTVNGAVDIEDAERTAEGQVGNARMAAGHASSNLQDYVVNPAVGGTEYTVDQACNDLQVDRTVDEATAAVPAVPVVPAVPAVPTTVFDILNSTAAACRLDWIVGTTDGLVHQFAVPSLPTDLPAGLPTGVPAGVPVALPTGEYRTLPANDDLTSLVPAGVPATPAVPAVPAVPSVDGGLTDRASLAALSHLADLTPVVPAVPALPTTGDIIG